eukprot:XP_011436766.1 PREDICTED: prostate-associated microseminoprotein [Crassostrea gigas]
MSANILAVLLVFGCGLIHLVTGQCIVVKKSEEKVEEAKSDVWLPNLFHDWISGCEYKGVQMKPGNEVIFPFPDCTVCVCTDKSRVICCSERMEPKSVPKHCKVLKEGCEYRVVMKFDKTTPCNETVTGKGR